LRVKKKRNQTRNIFIKNRRAPTQKELKNKDARNGFFFKRTRARLHFFFTLAVSVFKKTGAHKPKRNLKIRTRATVFLKTDTASLFLFATCAHTGAA